MPRRQVEFCEVSSVPVNVPVQRTVLGAPRLPPKAPECVVVDVDDRVRNPLLKR